MSFWNFFGTAKGSGTAGKSLEMVKQKQLTERLNEPGNQDNKEKRTLFVGNRDTNEKRTMNEFDRLKVTGMKYMLQDISQRASFFVFDDNLPLSGKKKSIDIQYKFHLNTLDKLDGEEVRYTCHLLKETYQELLDRLNRQVRCPVVTHPLVDPTTSPEDFQIVEHPPCLPPAAASLPPPPVDSPIDSLYLKKKIQVDASPKFHNTRSVKKNKARKASSPKYKLKMANSPDLKTGRRPVNSPPQRLCHVKDDPSARKFELWARRGMELQVLTTWEDVNDIVDKPKLQFCMFSYDEMIPEPTKPVNDRYFRNKDRAGEFTFLVPNGFDLKLMGEKLEEIGKEMKIGKASGTNWKIADNILEHHRRVFGSKNFRPQGISKQATGSEFLGPGY